MFDDVDRELPEFNYNHCRAYMLREVDYYQEPTILAEQYASEMDADEWLDDENHQIWEVAVEVVTEWEERND